MSFPTKQVHLGAAPTSEGYIWVSTDGDDTTGDGSFENPYASLTAAMAAISSTRMNIGMLGGSYEEAACVSWSTVNGVVLSIFGDVTLSTDSEEDQVIDIAPGVQTSTYVATIQAFGTLCIDHGNDGQDGIKVTHTDVAKKLILNVKNVYDSAYDSGDKFITVTHGGSGNAVRIYMEGRVWDECEGAIYFQSKDGGDRLYCSNCWLEGGIEFSTDATAVALRLKDCIVLHAGVTGGSTSTVAVALNCFSNSSGTLAALDGDDIAGNITGESIIGAS